MESDETKKMGYFGAAASGCGGGDDGESNQQRHQCVIELNGGADSLPGGASAGISQHANSNNYSSHLSAAEMESLAALCDTFLPSVAASAAADRSVAVFFETSASAAGTPERVRLLINLTLLLWNNINLYVECMHVLYIYTCTINFYRNI